MPKAFDAISRTQLWKTLYKKGLPLETITLSRQGRTNTTLRIRHQGKYGDQVANNVGVFRGSPISAILFIICHRRHDGGRRGNEPQGQTPHQNDHTRHPDAETGILAQIQQQSKLESPEIEKRNETIRREIKNNTS